ncbi:Protein FAR1-RELATED SEQUENCE [Arachis hypogaea]|nr:Protein FAR1-RELATED SEQUENCE [Arachis hypogaea]
MNGFTVRKNKIWRNVRNEVTQQEFVCFRHRFRGIGSVNDGKRQKREPKAETRCGCEAEMRVHVHSDSGRWIISYFQDVHNHELLDDRLTFMLPGHRKMDAAVVEQMNMMLRVGIKTPHIYSSFVQTVGGFQNLPFLKGDMEAHSDMLSVVGEPRSAVKKLTRAIFLNFRPMLFYACTLKSCSGSLVQECSLESKGLCGERSILLGFNNHCRNWMLNDLCRKMYVLACRHETEFADMTDKVLHEIVRLKEIEDSGDAGGLNEVGEASTLEGCLRDPQLVRCRKRQRKETVKGVKRCGLCRQRGHNRVSCQLNPNSRMNTQEGASYLGGQGEGETGTMEDSFGEEELVWDDATDVALDEGYDSQGTI